MRERATAAAARSTRPAGDAAASSCRPLQREETDDGITYRHVSADFDRAAGLVDDHRASGRRATCPTPCERVHELGAEFWPLAMTRELDDLILRLRANELELGTWVDPHEGRRRGRAGLRAGDRATLRRRTGWSTRSGTTSSAMLKRLDVTSPLADRADRAGLAASPARCWSWRWPATASTCSTGCMEDGDEEGEPAQIVLSASNFGTFPMGNGLSRLGVPVLRRRRRTSPSCARRPAGASTPPRRWSWAWSPTPPTTSTGRTRSGSCWRSAPRCRPTR